MGAFATEIFRAGIITIDKGDECRRPRALA